MVMPFSLHVWCSLLSTAASGVPGVRVVALLRCCVVARAFSMNVTGRARAQQGFCRIVLCKPIPLCSKRCSPPRPEIRNRAAASSPLSPNRGERGTAQSTRTGRSQLYLCGGLAISYVSHRLMLPRRTRKRTKTYQDEGRRISRRLDDSSGLPASHLQNNPAAMPQPIRTV